MHSVRDGVNEPHVVQPSATNLALRPLDNLHAGNVWVEDLDRHFHRRTIDLISHQEGCVNAAQLDTQDNTVEWVTILECDSDGITWLYTAGIPSVVKKSLAVTLGIEGSQL